MFGKDQRPQGYSTIWLTKWAILIGLLFVVSLNALASKHDVPLSAYRKYVWAALDAYEHRDFAATQRFLKEYKDVGSPRDKMIEAAGCDARLEVRLLTDATKAARTCMQGRAKSAHWTADRIEAAKIVILDAMRSGDGASLEPYLECAPADLTERVSFCRTPLYPNAADFKKFVATVHAMPEVMQYPEWRDIHVTKEHPDQIKPSAKDFKEQGFTAIDDGGQKWLLYTKHSSWHPCGMPGVPLLSLRRDKSGQIRIAGFAASCLDHP